MVFWKGPADLTISNPLWGKRRDLCAFLHSFAVFPLWIAYSWSSITFKKHFIPPLPCMSKDVTTLVWRSEVSFQDWVLCFHHLGSGDWTQIFRVGRKCLWPWVISPAAPTPLSTVLFGFAGVALSVESSIDCIKKTFIAEGSKHCSGYWRWVWQSTKQITNTSNWRGTWSDELCQGEGR